MNSLINGQLSDCIKASDRGLAYGDGLFETIEVSRGRLVYWQRHMDRLAAGCERLLMPAPNQAQLFEEASRLLAQTESGVLKIILTRGTGGRGYLFADPILPTRLLTLHPKPDYPPAYQTKGVNLTVCKSRLALNPQFAGLKHLNRLEQVMARSELNAAKHQEGLMLDYEEYLVEGIMSNLFWVSEGQLFTPELQLCGVQGVIRSIIIELAEKNSIPCCEGRYKLDQLLAADEIFMTNSLIGIWPVQRIDDHLFSLRSMTTKILELLNNEKGTGHTK